ncbi:hypothetical protein NDU88_011231 [Pleurodeles waltl]|uniref:Uncharacterized protein n=1 Tax=Pleurodeles waltl TaxID=8319 RepID=A0AAV7QZG2_PLEWA|nr:hypothetical protein NDU88_011231 [Pleurodeles waltl]
MRVSCAVAWVEKDDRTPVKRHAATPGTQIQEDAKEDDRGDDSSGYPCQDDPATCKRRWDDEPEVREAPSASSGHA